MYLQREETEESRFEYEQWTAQRRRVETEEEKVSGKKESRGGAFRSASSANSRLPRAPDSFNSRFSEFREVIAQEEKQNKLDTESPPNEIEEEDLVASEASQGRGTYPQPDFSADGHSEVLEETEGLGSRALEARRVLEGSPESGAEGTLQKMMRLRQALELDLFDSSREEGEELKGDVVHFSNNKRSVRSGEERKSQEAVTFRRNGQEIKYRSSLRELDKDQWNRVDQEGQLVQVLRALEQEQIYNTNESAERAHRLGS